MIPETAQAWAAVRARPDRGRAATFASPRNASTGRGRVDVPIPADLASALRSADPGAYQTWPVWATAAVVLHRRLGAWGPVCLASPPRRAGGPAMTVHRVQAAGSVPFGALVRELSEPVASSSREIAPVVQGTDDYPSGGADVERLAMPTPTDADHDLFDLVLADVAVHRGHSVPGSATITVDLDEALLRADPGTGPWTTEALAQRLRWLVRIAGQGLAAPAAPLSELGLLSADEQVAVVTDWNDTATPTPAALIGEAVAATVAASPDGIAADDVLLGQQLTYGQLAARAARLSHELHAGGLRRGDLVGVWGSACAGTLVASVAVWWAGGAVVLLDPAAPALRTRHAAAGVAQLITTSATRWPDPGHTPVIDGTEVPADAGRPSRTLGPLREAHPDDLAYVLHTSGSTGPPKGVGVTHRGLAHYLRWAMRTYRVTPGSRVPVASALSFDLTITALFGPLVTGGTVVLPEPREPISLRGCVRPALRAALVKITPSHLAALADEVPTVAPATDCLVLGGEGLTPGQLRVWQQVAPATRIVNEYGPTETTVAVLAHAVDDLDATWPAVPVGRPVDDATAYLLDDDLQPVPEGVLGELYLGGAGLARGYVGQAGATAARFVPHPFAASPGQRLYRTGDLAIRDERGDIVYVGRRDRQEKLGGVRVELAEIEAALLEVPGIAAAAVTVRRRPDGSASATAHIVCAAEPPSLGQLRRALADRIPRAAVPTSVLVVDALPLAPSGKVDLAALAATATPGAVTPARMETRAARSDGPLGPVETTLTTIWAELLGAVPGREDDFFALGGDSILAVRIVARAREAGLILRPSQVFELGTIARLAQVAEPVPEEPDEASPGPVPLTATQRWFLASSGAADGYAQLREFRLAAPRAPDDVLAALRGLVTRHDALRLRVRPRGSDWEQVLVAAEHAEPAVTLVALQGFPADEPAWRRGCAQASAATRAAGPMVACALGVADGSVQRLLLAVHHLAVDHLSWLFLVDDLESALAGRPVTEPAASFAAWARRAASDPDAAGFARAAPSGNGLPSQPDAAAPSRPRRTPQRATGSLPQATWSMLVEAARDAYNADPLDVLCTAVARSLDLADSTGALAVETSGRDGDGTADAVGWFTRVTRVQVPDSDGDPATALARMKDTVRRAARAQASSGPDSAATPPRVGVTHLGSVTPDGSAAPRPGQLLLPHAQTTFLADAPGLPTEITVTGAEVTGRLVVEVITASAEPSGVALAERILAELGVLGTALSQVRGPGVTASDFRRVDLDDDELAAILTGLQESG